MATMNLNLLAGARALDAQNAQNLIFAVFEFLRGELCETSYGRAVFVTPPGSNDNCRSGGADESHDGARPSAKDAAEKTREPNGWRSGAPYGRVGSGAPVAPRRVRRDIIRRAWCMGAASDCSVAVFELYADGTPCKARTCSTQGYVLWLALNQHRRE